MARFAQVGTLTCLSFLLFSFFSSSFSSSLLLPFPAFFHLLAINNCTNGVNNCANPGATCTYTGPGTYTCACILTKYTGNGVTCTGQAIFWVVPIADLLFSDNPSLLLSLSFSSLPAINNCTSGTNNCASPGGVCTSTGAGTFSCACSTGYNGTGTACTGMALEFPENCFLVAQFPCFHSLCLSHQQLHQRK